MSKTKRETPLWAVLTQGSLVALSIYFLGLLGVSALLVRGTMGEGSAFPLILVLGALASFVGGLITVRRTPWGTLPTGLAIAAIFAFALGITGLAFWESLSFLGRGGLLILAILGGGLLAGVLGGKRKKKGKRVRR